MEEGVQEPLALVLGLQALIWQGQGVGLGGVGKPAFWSIFDNRWGQAVWEGAQETKERNKSEALELFCWRVRD